MRDDQNFPHDDDEPLVTTNCHSCKNEVQAPLVWSQDKFTSCPHCKLDVHSGESFESWIGNNTIPVASESKELRITIDDIVTQAQVETEQLFQAGGINLAAKTYMCAQLARLRLEAKSIGFAEIAKQVTAADFLEAGLQHMRNRAVTYDKPNGERSMGKTIAAFNIITGHKCTEEEGWMLLGLLKKVRSVQGEYRADNYEDAAAYAALQGEAAARDRAK